MTLWKEGREPGATCAVAVLIVKGRFRGPSLQGRPRTERKVNHPSLRESPPPGGWGKNPRAGRWGTPQGTPAGEGGPGGGRAVEGGGRAAGQARARNEMSYTQLSIVSCAVLSGVSCCGASGEWEWGGVLGRRQSCRGGRAGLRPEAGRGFQKEEGARVRGFVGPCASGSLGWWTTAKVNPVVSIEIKPPVPSDTAAALLKSYLPKMK